MNDRNQKIIQLFIDGFSSGQIAKELAISRNSVAGVLNRANVKRCQIKTKFKSQQKELELKDVSDRKIERKRKRQVQAREALELAKQGFSQSEIAKKLNIGSSKYGNTQVCRMLKNIGDKS